MAKKMGVPEFSRFRNFKGAGGIAVNILLGAIPLCGIIYVTDILSHFGLVIYREQYLGLCLALVLASSFLIKPATLNSPRDRLPWYDILLTIGGAAVGVYVALFYPRIVPRLGYITLTHVVLGIISIVLVLEACRRLLGHVVVGVCILFLVYAHFAYLMPGILNSRKIPFQRLAIYLYLEPGSLLGIPFAIAATIIVAFIFFGQTLFVAGAGRVLSDGALAFLGKYRGGPAKGAVVASALFGSVSGSASANVATTGIVTIPLMKRVGYSPHFAGAVEAVASTGGLLLPPIMAATAFIMAEFLEIPYREVAIAAAVPAVLYYISLFAQLHLRALKRDIKGIPKEDLPSINRVLRRGWLYIIPMVALIYLMFGLNLAPESSAIYAAGLVLLVGFFSKEVRLTFGKVLSAFRDSGKAVLEIASICAMAGFIVGSMTITGLGLKLSNLLIEISAGHVFVLLVLAAIASIILGMGMPLIATYIMLVILIAPALVKSGVLPLAAHLFIMYFGAMSFLTPPVCIAAFVAAGIAKSDPMKTGFQAVPLAAVAFVVPFAFVYSPGLLLTGTAQEIIYSVLSALIGVIVLSIAFEGYLFGGLRTLIRLLLALSGILLLFPHSLFRLTGLAAALLSIMTECFLHRERRRTAGS
ncbi:MAG: TRAP transporter fused permease subunit [Pseudomonadota bacterium]